MRTAKEIRHEANDTIRSEIKAGLKQCTEGQRLKFKRMYSHKNLDADINSVVDNMPSEKLDWALRQIFNTLKTHSQLNPCLHCQVQCDKYIL